MKKLFSTVLLTVMVIGTANAGDRFSDLTKEYLYGKNSTVSVEVRRVIAKDSKTAATTLKLLTHDKDATVRKYAKQNLG